jgi:mRNA interferase RelE/StbE
MKVVASERFKKTYQKLPKPLQEQVDKKLLLLEENPGHPSLRVKKIAGTSDIREASVTMKYRITLQISEGVIILRVIGEHDKALRNP